MRPFAAKKYEHMSFTAGQMRTFRSVSTRFLLSRSRTSTTPIALIIPFCNNKSPLMISMPSTRPVHIVAFLNQTVAVPFSNLSEYVRFKKSIGGLGLVLRVLHFANTEVDGAAEAEVALSSPEYKQTLSTIASRHRRTSRLPETRHVCL